MAQEFGPRGITANVGAPGLIGETEFFHGKLSGRRREQLIANTMASPAAGHVTGQVVHVNGGAHLGK